VRVLIPGGRSDGRETYRAARTQQEREEASEKIIHIASEFPASINWATEIMLRNPARTYQDGSAMGMLRKREWLTSQGRGEPHRAPGNRMYLER
jgi:hypothetical protein